MVNNRKKKVEPNSTENESGGCGCGGNCGCN